MMLITTLQEEAINECLLHNIPFVIYALPETNSSTRFMASAPDDKGESHTDLSQRDLDSFFISRYASDEPYMSGVVDNMDEEKLIDWIASHPDIIYDGCVEQPYLTSTRRVSYDEAFKVMKRRLKRNGGKVVLSRHVSLFTTDNLVEIAESYFEKCPKAFRYMCYTPECGLWLGATPELLLESLSGSDEIHTMALAGTRSGDLAEGWDNKNINEHQLVVRFITDVLLSHGLEVKAEATADMQSANVTHLCTHITGRGFIKTVGSVINDLNPTPAVSGWPRQVAVAEIDAYETHQRRCYSGIIGVKDNAGLHVYVNLRCAFISPATLDGHDGWVFNIYAGGGLMADSNLDEEWQETSDKMQPILDSISSSIGNPIEAQFQTCK